MFSLIFMNMQIRYNLHTCVLPLDERNVSKPHIGSLDERTCQSVSLMIQQLWPNPFVMYVSVLTIKYV